jgi:DNA-binding NarL/FixJ family response regulator
MFTMHESDRLPTEVRQAKAQGYVLKSQAARNLIRAIERLLMGGEFFGPEPGPGPFGGPPVNMSMTS